MSSENAPLPYPTVEKCVDLGPFEVRLRVVREVNELLEKVDLSQATPPYWAELWASSVGLARHLCAREGLRGLRVLEIGCGLGLAGITAAKLGASVLLTDAEADAVAFAAHNALRNGCGGVQTRRLNWRFPDLDGRYDRILGADVVYDLDDFTPIARLVSDYLAADGRAVIAEPQRDIARDFYEAMKTEGFTSVRHVEDVELSGHMHRIGIATFARGGSGFLSKGGTNG